MSELGKKENIDASVSTNVNLELIMENLSQNRYQEVVSALDRLDLTIQMEISKAYTLLMKCSTSCSYYVDPLDESIGERIAAIGEAILIEAKRANYVVKLEAIVSNLNNYLKEGVQLLKRVEDLSKSANQPFEQEQPDYFEFYLDHFTIDNSVENEEWFEQLSHQMEERERKVNELCQYFQIDKALTI